MQSQETSANIFTAANALTFARLILLPVIMWGIVKEHGWVAVIAMLLVWITDLLDGRLARRLGKPSPFGKALDSTVDFVLLYSLFIAFYAAGRLATWQFGFVYLSMLSILTLQLAGTATGSAETATTRLGKPTGALQYGYLIFLVLREVLPESAALDTFNLVFFGVLALAILANTAQIVIKLRSML